MKVEPLQPIRADQINALPRETLEGVKSSPHTRIYRAGDKMLIQAKASGRNTSVSSASHTTQKLTVPVVSYFPSPPAVNVELIFFTGDNQLWACFAGQDRWYPLQKATTYSGMPAGMLESEFDNDIV